MKNLIKILEAIYKFVAKQFLRVMLYLLIALPMSFAMLWLLAAVLPDATTAVMEQGLISATELYLLMYLLSFAMLYLGRTVLTFLEVTLGSSSDSSS